MQRERLRRISLYRSSKYSKIGPYGLGALLLISVAVILRVVLISNGWPPTNSDEGTMGLDALHILTRGELPIFLYGQNYMGTIQAYFGAFFFQLFGSSLFALRIGLVIMYAGFLLALYLLARLLYSKGIALASIFLLCWGSSNTLALQLLAVGGALETQLFGTLSLLLASWLALSFDPDRAGRERRKRLVAYGFLGGVIGLAIWSHLLVLPFVGTSLLLLLLFCRRELCTEAGLFAILGYLVGSLPLLLFNIQHPDGNLLQTTWSVFKTGGTGHGLPADFRLSLLATIAISIPTATGASPLCPLSAAEGQWVHQFSLPCVAFQGYWGLGVIILWTLAASVLIREMQKHHRAFSASGSSRDKEFLVRCTGRLMLLASAGLTVLAYISSPAPTLIPILSSRYLVGLLVTIPVIVGILWPKFALGQSVLTHLVGMRMMTKLGKMADMIKICLLCFISFILLLGTVTTFQHIPDGQQQNQREDTLINDLLRLHTSHIYSDYWTCDRLIFVSHERIICGSLDKDLSQWENRYPPYWQIVHHDPRAAYVFHIKTDNAPGISQDQTFANGIAQDKAFASRFGTDYHRLYIAGYAVYLPVRR